MRPNSCFISNYYRHPASPALSSLVRDFSGLLHEVEQNLTKCRYCSRSPNERHTALGVLQFLLAHGKTQNQVSVVPVEGSDGGVTARGLECAEGHPEEYVFGSHVITYGLTFGWFIEASNAQGMDGIKARTTYPGVEHSCCPLYRCPVIPAQRGSTRRGGGHTRHFGTSIKESVHCFLCSRMTW